MSAYRIATIVGNAPGAAAAIDAALGALEALGMSFTVEPQAVGEAQYLATGVALPHDALERLRNVDAVFCGSPPSTRDPRIPVGALEHGLVFALRTELRLGLNIRRFTDVRLSDAPTITVVRENSEGAYFNPGTVVNPGRIEETAVEVSTTSYAAVERSVRYAFELASPSGSVVLAHKTHVLVASGQLWERVFWSVASEYPQVRVASENVDTLCAHLVLDPRRYEVIVCDNVFGDIVSDVAGAALDAIGHSGSAELSSIGGPSLFEPVHGPQDGRARPVSVFAALSAAATMASALGERAIGEALAAAVLVAARVPVDDQATITAEVVDLAKERLVETVR